MAMISDRNISFDMDHDVDYVPRSSRDKESSDYKALSEEDKYLINQLRQAAAGTRNKINTLEDKINERERTVPDHVPTGLVDMYSKTGVSREMSSRLNRPQNQLTSLANQDSHMLPAKSPLDRYLEYDSGSRDAGGPVRPFLAHMKSPIADPQTEKGAGPENRGKERELEGGGSFGREQALVARETAFDQQQTRELKRRLAIAEDQIETLTIQIHNKDVELETTVASRVADVVAEIREAQKSRDEAMMGRMQLAHDERDTALAGTLHMGTNYQSNDEKQMFLQSNPENQTVDALLAKIEAEDRAAFKPGFSSEEDHHTGSDEDIDRIINERNRTVSSYQKVLNEFEVTKDIAGPKNLQDRLRVVSMERDLHKDEIYRLEDELQTLRVYYSLHNSLATSTRSGPDPSMKGGPLIDQLRSISDERDDLARRLTMTEERASVAEQEVQQLSRLVAVLRRKLNSSGLSSECSEHLNTQLS